MGLTRSRQLGLKIESAEGTEETLTATEFGGNRKEIKKGIYVANYKRELVRVSLSQLRSLKGEKYIKFNWTEECVGGGAATAAPWHATLKGLGWAQTQLKAAACGSVTVSGGGASTFHIGQSIGNHATQGSATKTGIFVSIENGKLVYVPVTGTFASSDQIFNYGSAAQSNVTLSGAPANAGYRFLPVTETDAAAPPTVTIEVRDTGLRWTGIGCRGMGGFTMNRGEPLLFNAEYQGACVFDTDGYTPRSASAMTGIADFLVDPSLVLGIPLTFRIGETDYSPVMTKLDVKFGNKLALRATIGTSLANSGFLATRITGREIMAGIDPEFVAPGTFNFPKKFVYGDAFEIYAAIGQATNGNGKVFIHGPSAQCQGDLEFGDRDGIDTLSTDALLTGSADDELGIYHVFA